MTQICHSFLVSNILNILHFKPYMITCIIKENDWCIIIKLNIRNMIYNQRIQHLFWGQPWSEQNYCLNDETCKYRVFLSRVSGLMKQTCWLRDIYPILWLTDIEKPFKPWYGEGATNIKISNHGCVY